MPCSDLPNRRHFILPCISTCSRSLSLVVSGGWDPMSCFCLESLAFLHKWLQSIMDLWLPQKRFPVLGLLPPSSWMDNDAPSAHCTWTLLVSSLLGLIEERFSLDTSWALFTPSVLIICTPHPCWPTRVIVANSNSEGLWYWGLFLEHLQYNSNNQWPCPTSIDASCTPKIRNCAFPTSIA